MQLLVLTMTANPGSGDAVLAALTEFMGTAAVEHGVMRYRIARDEASPERFAVSEEWPSADAHEAFAKTPVFRQFIGSMLPLVAGRPEAAFYRIVAGGGETSQQVKTV